MSESISGWALGALGKTLVSKLLNALPTFLLRRLVMEAEFKSRVVIAFKQAMPVAWLGDTRPSHGLTGFTLFVANHTPVAIQATVQKITVAAPPHNFLTQIGSESSDIPAGKTVELRVNELALTDQQVRFLKSKGAEIIHVNINCTVAITSRLHAYSTEISSDLYARIDAPVKKARR